MRSFIVKVLTASILLTIAASVSPLNAIAAGQKSPNIVFVLFDDLGYGQPQSYRPESKLRLPNFDRLASEGMRFTDAHSASGVCTPTRYGVLTGRYPWRIGQYGVCTTYTSPRIPTSRLTVASLLKQQGYRTACIGKWHLGLNWVDGKPGTEKKVPLNAKYTDGPNALGFDYFLGFTHARNIFTVMEQDRVVRHVKDVENQPLMIEKTVKWLDERKGDDKPFFLYFPMCPPHTPVVPAPEFIGKSGAKDVVKKDPKYGDWVYQGDHMLGQILESLTRNGLAQNTLVIATADNGAAGRPYAPLRASKASIYEGGHRVPFAARWPGKIAPGSICETTICLNDLMATVADLHDVKLPENAAEDSFSILPLLMGNLSEYQRLNTVHQSHKGDLAIREGDWKCIYLKSGVRELYNLKTDIGETNNVIATNQAVASRLTSSMQNLIDRGRSNPGEPQQNDARVTLKKRASGKPSPQNDKKKRKREKSNR